MSGLLRGNFDVKQEVMADDAPQDFNAAFRKKAIESIGGSMVFVERKQVLWDGDAENVETTHKKG